MCDCYAFGPVPTTGKDLIRLAKEVDFIQLILVDFNGMPRIKVYPSDAIESLVVDGATTVVCTMTFAADGTVVGIPDQDKINYGNIRIRPVFETTRKWPWWNLLSDTTALQIFAYPEWLSGDRIECDPRTIALRQLKRLHDRGLDILCGTECEYRLFKKDRNESGDLVPAHSTLNLFFQDLVAQYQNIYVEMNRRMRAAGFKFDLFHSEYAFGQIEFPLAPEWGIKSADDLVRFKMIARDVARENDYLASFMSKPMPRSSGNGYHFNHSIWKRKDGEVPSENIMLDLDDVDKMSSFAKHWTAGLLHHASAMSAIVCPTVNCFRRLHNPWAPSHINWGIENRFASFRCKNGGTHRTTCLENRCPSSAANPYLTLAVTIAAGLDGVDRSLPLIADGSKEMGYLPHSLAEALECLKKDEMLCSVLGEQFIDWFGAIKLDELTRLKTVNIKEDRPEDFEKERNLYLEYI